MENVEIDKWVVWLMFGGVLEVLSLFGLVLVFIQPPVKGVNFSLVALTALLFVGGLLCLWQARMYYVG